MCGCESWWEPTHAIGLVERASERINYGGPEAASKYVPEEEAKKLVGPQVVPEEGAKKLENAQN
jgi:hypothetical protein